MKAFLAIGGKRNWDEEPQIEIEADDRPTLGAVAKVFSALNGNRTVRLSDTEGYRNQGAYIVNHDIKIAPSHSLTLKPQ